MKLSGVRLSVRLCPSVSLFGRRKPLRRVCCCGPGGQEISIDCHTAGAQQQMRAVSRCQLTPEAEHRLLVLIFVRTSDAYSDRFVLRRAI